MSDKPTVLIDEENERALVSAAVQSDENWESFNREFDVAELGDCVARTVAMTAQEMEARGETVGPDELRPRLYAAHKDKPDFRAACVQAADCGVAALYESYAGPVQDSIDRRREFAKLQAERRHHEELEAAILDPRRRDWRALLPELNGRKNDLSSDPFLCHDVFALSASCDAGQVLLGNEWLRRTDQNSLVSMAGTGKSVAADGGAMLWSAGLPYLGIQPAEPLRVALFVSEDDRVTIGQQREGLLAYSGEVLGRGLTAEERELIRENLLIDFSREHVGEDFVPKRLEPVAADHKADLVIINPLLGYVGGNLVELGSKMLRGDLLPALQRLNAGCLTVLHTNKLGREGMTDISQLYAATGGAEMANIPRGIVILNPTDDENIFRLRVEKRLTIGWTDEHGSFVREHYVARTGDPMRPAWISLPYHETRAQLEAGETKPGRPAKCAGKHVREVFAREGCSEMEKGDLLDRLEERCQVVRKTAENTVNGLLSAGQLTVARDESRKGGGHKLQFLALA